MNPGVRRYARRARCSTDPSGALWNQLLRLDTGRRAALILSPRAYNAKARLAIACPITSQVKGYPFEVALPAGGAVTGVILADHVKNLDWTARRVEFAAKAAPDIVTDVRERLRVLLGL